MNTFRLEIESSGSGVEAFEDAVCFTGRDSSGSFGIMAHAERRVTVLSFGIASFRRSQGNPEYIALPGGVLYFRNNELLIATQAYVRSSDFFSISAALENEIKESEARLYETRKSLRRLDEEILKRLSSLSSSISS